MISVEKLPGEKGASVEFRTVLMVNRDGELLLGEQLKDARVAGEVVRQSLAKKIEVVKFKRRKNYRRHRGHRQPETTIRIMSIEV
jgi:large subunit ribosomal protein L21